MPEGLPIRQFQRDRSSSGSLLELCALMALEEACGLKRSVREVRCCYSRSASSVALVGAGLCCNNVLRLHRFELQH